MIKAQFQSRIDRLWEEFNLAGIADPLTIVEQISLLIFARMLDLWESEHEHDFHQVDCGEEAPRIGVYFRPDQQHLRWENLKRQEGREMLRIIRDELLPHYQKLASSDSGLPRKKFIAEFTKSAVLKIYDYRLLKQVVTAIDALPLTHAARDEHWYGHLLDKLATSKSGSHFAAPRHIVRLLVSLALHGSEQLAHSWRVSDPNCGAGEFLVEFIQSIRELDSAADESNAGQGKGHRSIRQPLDLMTQEHQQLENRAMLHGFDSASSIFRIAAINMMLHGIDDPLVFHLNPLEYEFIDRFPELANEHFDLVISCFPFAGASDFSLVDSSLTQVLRTKKTELLFLLLTLRMLRAGGRCAVVVPDSVLFGASNVHKQLREMLVEQHQLEAVITLPSGVFKPLTAVGSAIIILTKNGRTTETWFYDVTADGFSLDGRREPIQEDDLPDVIEQWVTRSRVSDADRTAKSFFVSKSELASNCYDLSINRYKTVAVEAGSYDPPLVIVDRLRKLNVKADEMLAEVVGDCGPKTLPLVDFVPLGDVAKFIHGVNFKAVEKVALGSMGSVACVGAQNVRPELDLTDLTAISEELVRDSRQYLREADILVRAIQKHDMEENCSWVPSLPYPAIAGGRVLILRAHVEYLEPRFLYHWFSSSLTQQKVFYGSGHLANARSINAAHCLQLQIPLPPVHEQKRIADILDSARFLRENYLRSLGDASSLLQVLTNQLIRYDD